MKQEIKNTLYINELNEKENQKIVELINLYLGINTQIQAMQEKLSSVMDELDKLNIQTVGIEKQNIRFTITNSKIVKKIDYDKTLENVADKSIWKKQVISQKWDDKKIIDGLGDKVVYIEETSKPRITINKLNKEVDNE